MAIRRKALSGALQSQIERACELLESRAIRETQCIDIDQADNATRTVYPLAFSEQARPRCGSHESEYGAHIDHIKGFIGEVERLCCVHGAEPGIIETAHLRVCVCVINHSLADIDACYFLVRKLMCHIAYPAGGRRRYPELYECAKGQSAREAGHPTPVSAGYQGSAGEPFLPRFRHPSYTYFDFEAGLWTYAGILSSPVILSAAKDFSRIAGVSPEALPLRSSIALYSSDVCTAIA